MASAGMSVYYNVVHALPQHLHHKWVVIARDQISLQDVTQM